ncbi:hypothetical protein VTI28DRAFT_1043 [Corynascus sepedonium]
MWGWAHSCVYLHGRSNSKIQNNLSRAKMQARGSDMMVRSQGEERNRLGLPKSGADADARTGNDSISHSPPCISRLRFADCIFRPAGGFIGPHTSPKPRPSALQPSCVCCLRVSFLPNRGCLAPKTTRSAMILKGQPREAQSDTLTTRPWDYWMSAVKILDA